MTSWRTMARNAVKSLEAEAERLADTHNEDRCRINDDLKEINRKLGDYSKDPVRKRLLEAWTGDSRSSTWADIHLVEAKFEYLKRPDEVVDDARRLAKDSLGSERARRFERDLRRAKGDPVGDKGLAKNVDQGTQEQDRYEWELAAGVIREVHAAAATRYEAARQQQRGVVGLSSLLLLGALTTALLQWRVFPLSPLVPPPKGAEGLSSWATLGLVMFFGLIGGGFSALIALYVTNRTYTSTYWFDPRPSMAFMKMSVGVWSAVFGVLGVASEIVVGKYSNFASLAVLSFLFGYGQQLLTGFIDKRAESLAVRTRPEAQELGAAT